MFAPAFSSLPLAFSSLPLAFSSLSPASSIASIIIIIDYCYIPAWNLHLKWLYKWQWCTKLHGGCDTFSTCLPPLFHCEPPLLILLFSFSFSSYSSPSFPPLPLPSSSPLFLCCTGVGFFFRWWAGPVSFKLIAGVKIHSVKKHAWNEEASLQWYLNIVMYDSNYKHRYYNQLHAPIYCINACMHVYNWDEN